MMNSSKQYLVPLVAVLVSILLTSCSQTQAATTPLRPEINAPSPLSDPENKRGWVLNPEVSDEFTGTELIVAKSPAGAVRVPAGEYTLSCKVWLDQGRASQRFVPGF
ncbi:MAG: hypothetical protein AAFN92_20275 [Bacteroidota bacterium]